MAEEQDTVLLRKSQEEREYQIAVEQAKAEGKPLPGREWHPDFAGWAPAAMFNGMIAPVTPLAIRGVIWYQGESNAGEKAPLYAHLFQTMIADWRRAWDEGDFPFLFVQLANWNTPPDGRWAEVRDAQREALALRNTGMAVAIDMRAARAITYGDKIESSGPLYRQLTHENHSLRVCFDHASGLTAKGGGPLLGFESRV